MKMLLYTCFFICITPVSFAQNKSAKRVHKGTGIDTTLIEDYLNDPRNNTGPDKMYVDSDCKTKDSIDARLIHSRLITTCICSRQGEVLYHLTYTVFKVDSTWTFGTNGWMLMGFECVNKQMPLKYGLQVGSSIRDFESYFGPADHQERNSYIYERIIGNRRMTLILQTDNNVVTHIKIIGINAAYGR